MGRAKGKGILSLTIMSICAMMLRPSQNCCTGLLVNETEIQVKLPKHTHSCDSNYSQPSSSNLCDPNFLLKTKLRMINKWNRFKIFEKFLENNGFIFEAGHDQCTIIQNAQLVQFICDHDFTDFCPQFIIIGYTTWTNTSVKVNQGAWMVEAVETRLHTEIDLFGMRKETSYNVSIKCIDGEPCLSDNIQLMFLKYKDNLAQNRIHSKHCD